MNSPFGLSKWRSWDSAGLLLSAGCALHCLGTALLPTLLGGQPTDSCCHECSNGVWNFHSIALLFVMFVALMVCRRCCHKGGWYNQVKMLVGLALLWAPQVSPALGQWETAFTVSGALLVGWAHWANINRSLARMDNVRQLRVQDQ